MKKSVAIILICLFLLMNAGCSEAQFQKKDEVMRVENFEQTLTELGFENLPRELIEKTKSAPDFQSKDSFYRSNALFYFFFELGFGSYDFDSYVWSPSSDQVYSLDLEAHEITSMYTNFLRGIESIGGVELKFSEIEEIHDFNMTEPVRLSFLLNGVQCAFELEENFDWYNPEIFDRMNQALEDQGNVKRLYFASDGDVCCVVFYCNSNWADSFTKKTGIPLFKSNLEASDYFG